MNWEDIPCDGITLDDGYDSAIDYFLDLAIGDGRIEPELCKSSKESVLYNLGLIKDGIPTNGAVLLFGKTDCQITKASPSRLYLNQEYRI